MCADIAAGISNKENPSLCRKTGVTRGEMVKFRLRCKMYANIAMWSANEKIPGLCCKTGVPVVGA